MKITAGHNNKPSVTPPLLFISSSSPNYPIQSISNSESLPTQRMADSQVKLFGSLMFFKLHNSLGIHIDLRIRLGVFSENYIMVAATVRSMRTRIK